MRKFLVLLVCLSLSIFTVARAMKPTHVFAPEPDEALVNDATTEEETPFDNDDSTSGASNDEDEDVNDDNGDDSAGDEDTGPDDGADDGDDGGSGDQGG
jgi:hypothetical protein